MQDSISEVNIEVGDTVKYSFWKNNCSFLLPTAKFTRIILTAAVLLSNCSERHMEMLSPLALFC